MIKIIRRNLFHLKKELPKLSIQKVIPEYKDKKMNIPKLSYNNSREQMEYWAKENKVFKSYYGLGYHQVESPNVLINNFIQNPNFYSAYIPYQSEISQGRLELQFNYQKMITNLYNMDISNCSLLDESSAASEAIITILSKDIKNKHKYKLFLDKEVFPQNRSVINTRAKLLGIPSFDIPIDHNLFVNAKKIFKDPSILFLQVPNFKGNVYDLEKYIGMLKYMCPDLKVIVSMDPLMTSIFEPAGTFNCDIVVGSMQRFGLPMWNGGPHAGVFATSEKYLRHIPGRIVGKSIDASNIECYRLALQAREQHIKKERALSNICTSQALLANYSALYAMYLGPDELRRHALDIRNKTLFFKAIIKQSKDYLILNDEFDLFDTLEVQCTSDQIFKKTIYNCKVNNVLVRSNSKTKTLYLTIDSKKSTSDILVLLRDCFNITSDIINSCNDFDITECVKKPRESPFLNDEIFNNYNTEHDITRYITKISRKDLSLTQSMIPLGSCTMKLNSADLFTDLFTKEWADIHPFQGKPNTIGYTNLINKIEYYLKEITGLDACSFQSNSGATGEYSALNCFKSYFNDNGYKNKNILLIPDSAHGTNFASGSICGFKIIKLKSDDSGNIDIEKFNDIINSYGDEIAGLMITYPSTYGFFEKDFRDIVSKVKSINGLIYCDGANMNALMGNVDLKELGVDACHLNLHKTFGIPHGGGGPGMGPILVTENLKKYLPSHPIIKFDNHNNSYGSCASAPESSAVLLSIVYYYISMLGDKGIKEASHDAILNANYIAENLKEHYNIPYVNENGYVSHELIIDTKNMENGITDKDIAKRLMDYGFHAPTMSWPVSNSLMIEPTETETIEELDRFINSMKQIRDEIKYYPEILKNAPHSLNLLYKDTWNYEYTKEMAYFPLSFVKKNKFNISTCRVNDIYGDRNLVLK